MKKDNGKIKVAGCLHTHTTNSDGDLRPKELVNYYRALGMDFVAITDHDYLTEIESPYDDFVILHGFEDTFRWDIIHIEDNWNERGISFLCHPRRWNLSKERIKQLITRYNLMGVEKYTAGVEQYMGHLDTIEFGNDDFHSRGMQGYSWNIVTIEEDEFNKENLIEAIKKGNVECKNGDFRGIRTEETKNKDKTEVTTDERYGDEETIQIGQGWL